MHACKQTSKKIVCTLCSSTLEQATDNLETDLESFQKGNKDPTMKMINMCMHASTSQNLVCILCSPALKQAIDKFLYSFGIVADRK